METIALIIIIFLGITLQGYIFRRFYFSRLDYTCGFSVSEAYEEDELNFVEVVHNRKLMPLPWLKADIHSSSWLDFAGGHSVLAQESRRITSTYFLKSYQKTTRRWKLKCLKRGVFTVENVTLTGGDLLGNDVVSVPYPAGACLTVYPKIIDLEDYLVPVNYMQGETLVSRWIIDDPFYVSGAREYMPGDPMNRIHWSASAREGRLMVRRNDFTSRTTLAVLLNIQSREFEPNSVVYKERIEFGIKVAATVIDRALQMTVPVGFGTNGCTIQEENTIFTAIEPGREHAGYLLKLLAMLKLWNLRDFEDFLALQRPLLRETDVVIITSYLNDGIYDQARHIIKQGNRVKIVFLGYTGDMIKYPGDLEIFCIKDREG